jgi:hypothetical protein
MQSGLKQKVAKDSKGVYSIFAGFGSGLRPTRHLR